MAQDDSSTIAVKSIRLGVILVAALLIGGYFFWSAMTWDERLTFTWIGRAVQQECRDRSLLVSHVMG